MMSLKMVSLYPSVQAFYKPEPVLGASEVRKAAMASELGDGFTKEEVENVLDPLKIPFNPNREYLECAIKSLIPGPQAVRFTGRVVNFNTQYGQSKSHAAATGWHYMIVKDDTGSICVKLYFIIEPYGLKLGMLLTIWTPYIGKPANNTKFFTPNAPNTTSIFPGRETSVHIVIHGNSDNSDSCRVPLEYGMGKPLPGLMTLKSFIGGGHEIRNVRILGCVKNIGPTKTITNMKGTTSNLTEVVIFDDTAEIILKLWGTYNLSARDWTPGQTILLLSNPAFKLANPGRSNLGVSHATMIDVEPVFPDADWLRKYALNLLKIDFLDQRFPPDLWDVEYAMLNARCPLFTIAEVDECVRVGSKINFVGILNVTIMEIDLVLYQRRNMMMCAQCCGVPVYACTSIAKCKSCDSKVTLQLNPKVIGTMIDETGNILPGKLLWSGKAWEQLFGRPVEELVKADAYTLTLMEQRLSFMRVHLMFGWADEIGRLAILAVMM